MSDLSRPSRRASIGVALSAQGLTAVRADGVVDRVPFDAVFDPTTQVEVLAGAFSRLADRAPEYEGASITVAVVPPLVEGRSLELPPVSPEEAEIIVRRNPAAHFLLGGGSVLVGVQRADLGETADGLFGAAIPRSLADAVHDAAKGAGLELARLVPAHASWIDVLHGGDGPEATGLVALVDGTAHVLSSGRDGGMVHRRLFASDVRAIAEVLKSVPGRVAVSGRAEGRKGVCSALTAAGVDVLDAGRDAEELAARHASEAMIEFVSPRLAMERRDRSHRTLGRMLAGVILLLVAAGAIQLWGANRSLDRVREWRADIREDVAPLLAVADSIARFEASRARIEALERSRSSWTIPLVELSMLLPEGAHLEGLQIVGDTLLLDAVADRAGAVVDALGSATALDGVGIQGSIRREVVGGATRSEQFRLRAVRGQEWSAEDGPSAEGAM